MKKIRVFSVPWHQAHQTELLKFDFIDWNYVINHTRKFDKRVRPIPESLKWVPYYEKGKYDLAILHVDQQCLIEHLGKSKLFKELLAQVDDIPIIVVNHGTPVYPEMFMQYCVLDGYEPTEKDAIIWAREKMKKLLSTNKNIKAIVVNSHEAKNQWGLADVNDIEGNLIFGKTIIHGLDKEEWFDNKKEPRVATFISAAGIGDKYYGRNLFSETRDVLSDRYGIGSIWIDQDAKFNSFDEYRDFMSRTLVYFNPTLGSPMPRTRTEAMFSGCCIVTTRHQDADSFIKNGENGFICLDNPLDAAEKIAWCINNYKEAIAIGEKGRETALKIFSSERFGQDWKALIEKVLNTKI